MRTPDEPPIVVGINGAAASLAAVRLAAREAMARGRPLRVVHAFTWPGSSLRAPQQDYAAARHEAAGIVQAAVATARRCTPSVQVTSQLIDGLPIRVLLQQSRAAELLVLGHDDGGRAAQLSVDSVLLQTVSHAWCPVAVARGPRPPSGTLLAAVDGSPDSIHALRHAAIEARRRSVAIEVAHVVERSGPSAEAAGRRLLAAAVAAVPELPAPRTRLLIGDPAIALVRASRSARMVIVGPRGAGGSTLLGSVAEKLLRRCVCPTVFVHGSTTPERCSPGTVRSVGAMAG
jgi:nucleotide-binding universal stress UspA family protein